MKGKAKVFDGKRSVRLLFICMLILLLAGTGIYFLVHHILSSKAADDSTTSKISRGVVNDLSEFVKDVNDDDGDGVYTANSTYSKTLGTPSNPFLVLEIVPNNNYAFFGYMIDGCQPFDMGEVFMKAGSNAGGVGTSNGGFDIGSFPNIQTQYAQVSKVFTDEHIYEEKNYGADGFNSEQVNQKYYTKDWRLQASKELSAVGYYEYVGSGKGSFKYAGEKLTNEDKIGYIKDNCLDSLAESLLKEKYSSDSALLSAFIDSFVDDNAAVLQSEMGGMNPTQIKVSFTNNPWQRYGNNTYLKYFQETSGLGSSWGFYYNGDGQTEMSVIRKGFVSKLKEDAAKEFNDKVDELTKAVDAATTDAAKTSAEKALNDYLNSFYNFDNIAVNKLDSTVYNGKYAPNFVNVGFGNGSWIWVSLETGTTSLNAQTVKNIKKTSNYNRRAENATDKISFKLGDREYTSRTDTGYYVSVNNSKLICLNDFFTNCMNLYGKGKSAVENYSIVYKVAEPWELAEHPEWIDRADLMYIHQSDETGMNGSGKFFDTIVGYNSRMGLSGDNALTPYHDNDSIASTIRVNTGLSRTQLGDDFGKLKSDSSKQNDITFDCTMRMFKKVNGFDVYKKNRAPIIYPASLFQGTGNYFTKSVSGNYLEYTTMDENTAGVKYSNTGVNNNVYKFLLMQNLMDPINFNKFFVEGKRSSNGEKVIQDLNGTGSCTSHSGDAATYWCVQTFLPTDYKQSGSWATATDVFGNKVDYIDKYKIYAQGGNSFLNPKSNQAIHGYGCVYNGNNVITTLFGTSYVNSGSGLDGYDELEGYFNSKDSTSNLTDFSSFTWADIVHFLLQYNRGGDTDEDFLDGDMKLKILEIEPSNDFVLTENVMGAYLPATDYIGEYDIEYMTTNELNGDLSDLATYYDMIYIGNQTRKFNLKGTDVTGGVNYNDSKLAKGYSYIHVGDEYYDTSEETMRTSGNDITTIKYNSLRKYFRSKKVLVLDKNIKSNVAKYADPSSNMYTYLKYVTDSSANGSINSVYGMVDFYSDSIIEKINELISSRIKFTKSPDGKILKTDDTSLDFAYTLNKSGNGKYGVRLYLDSSHNGVIDEDANGNRDDELLYDSASADRNDVSGVSITGAKGGTYDAIDQGKLTLDLNKLSSEMKDVLAVGNLTWMIEVYNTSNEDDSAILRGTVNIGADVYKALTKKESAGSDAEYDSDLKILQIVPDDKKSDPSANLELALKDTGSDFYKYTKKADSKFYEYYGGITINTLTISEYVAMFDGLSESSDNVTKYTEVGGNVNYFYPSELGTDNDLTIADGRTYNMLVVTDASKLLDDASYNDFGAVSYIPYVATSGSRIVFTGDALNSGDEGSDNFNNFKRILGLNRYDNKAQGYDSQFKVNDSAISADVKDYTYMRAMEEGDDNDYKVFNNKKWVGTTGSVLKFGTAAQYASNISRNNQGMISESPYKIDENIGIYATSAKDYTLNLYNPNVNVWYSLAGDYYDDKAVDKDFHDVTDYSADDNWKLSAYGISPNDAANNYYVYTLANVTYCGINLSGGSTKGQMKKATKYADNTPQEVQLFVNTLVSAQNQSTPSVIITDVTDINPNNEDKEKTVFDEITVTDADSANYEMADLGTKKTLVDKFFYSLGLAGQKDEKTSYNYKEYYKGENGEIAEGDGGVDTTIIPPEGYDENKDNSDPDNENVPTEAKVSDVTDIFTHAYTYDLLYYGPASFAEKVQEREGVSTNANGINETALNKISSNPQDDNDGNTIYNTNKIFFSPIEKLKLYGKIKKFNAYLCTTTDNKEIGTSKKVTSIYEKRGKNYYRYDASANGYTTADGNYLMNRNSYFILYNKYDTNYNTVKFVIETDTHISVAYLCLQPQEEEESVTSEDVYLFELD